MSEWLERLRSLVRTHDRAPDTAQSRRVETVLVDRSLFASEAGRLDVVLEAIGEAPVDPRTLEHLVGVLKAPGVYDDLGEGEARAHLGFWRALVARQPDDAVLAAHLADVEMALGETAAGMARFVEVFERKADLFFEFGWDLEDDARAIGGDILFRWQVQLLRWFLQAAADHLESGEEVRELYGSLLDEYRDQPERLAVLHPFGDEIHRLEVAGDLPRAMVVRRRRSRDAEG